ncbi:MAG: class I SAM-dependent methyltransferase, partial [Candidatus Krumholzibacteria bacterium]|nr:class I SAM-dependent methyltransferase [Candidatus Krumholzibacteria bacterium]
RECAGKRVLEYGCGTGSYALDLARGAATVTGIDMLEEIRRVLEPDGEAVFFEPLGHNPLINLYRRLAPAMRSADEHPLTSRDLETLRAFFGGVEIRYFHLLSLAAVVWRRLPGFEGLLRCLETVDHALFRVPALRRQAWIAVIRLSAPVTDPQV